MRPDSVEVRFLDENNVLRAGSLISPFRISNEGTVDVEHNGDHEITVFALRSDSTGWLFKTHMSRVASMHPAIALDVEWKGVDVTA